MIFLYVAGNLWNFAYLAYILEVLVVQLFKLTSLKATPKPNWFRCMQKSTFETGVEFCLYFPKYNANCIWHNHDTMRRLNQALSEYEVVWWCILLHGFLKFSILNRGCIFRIWTGVRMTFIWREVLWENWSQNGGHWRPKSKVVNNFHTTFPT